METLRLVLLLGVAALLATLSSCKGDDPSVTEAQKITNLLTGSPWKIQSVTVDNVAHDELYPNLSVTFTSTGFTATNGLLVWPTTGTWTFTDKTATTFSRNDGVEVTINEISDTRLVLSLTWTKTTLGGGRANSLSGKNVFTLTK
jgi:hypothetical protein